MFLVSLLKIQSINVSFPDNYFIYMYIETATLFFVHLKLLSTGTCSYVRIHHILQLNTELEMFHFT